MLAVGLLFKIGAVPFQSWVPDVYQGAPTSVTAFMAAGTKIAAVGVLLRVLMVAVPGCAPTKTPGVTPTGGVSTPELPYPTTDVSSILI